MTAVAKASLYTRRFETYASVIWSPQFDRHRWSQSDTEPLRVDVLIGGAIFEWRD